MSLTASSTELEYPPAAAATRPGTGSREGILRLSSEGDDPSTGVPPVDKGVKAYQFLLGAFLIELVTWSIPTSYGIFLDFYMTSTPLGQKPSASFLLSLAGTCQSGIMYCTAPFVNYGLSRYPQHSRTMLIIGMSLVSSSLVIASFATQPWQIVLVQGVMYGLGGTILYNTCFLFISDWFVRRRGLATGACFAGTSVGGVFLPYLTTLLLSKYKERTTLRALGIMAFVLIGAAIPAIRPRLPLSQRGRVVSGSAFKISKLVQDRLLWLFFLAVAMQALGYFTVMLYIPTFATSLRMSSVQGTTALAVVNAAATVSRLSIGILSDFVSPYVLAASTLMTSALATFFLWGFASTTFAPFLVYSIIFGLVCGGFTSVNSGVVKDLVGDDLKQAGFLFGFISLSRGFGNIMTSPISSALLAKPDIVDHRPSSVYKTSFASIVLFSGGTLLASAALNVAATVVQRRRKKAE